MTSEHLGKNHGAMFGQNSRGTLQHSEFSALHVKLDRVYPEPVQRSVFVKVVTLTVTADEVS